MRALTARAVRALTLVALCAAATGCPKKEEANPTPASTAAPTQAPQAAPTAAPPTSAPAGKFMQLAKEGKPLYATIETSMGTIVAELDPKIAPNAVENFVGLAAGEKEWTTPQGERVKKPLYDGTIFHRVIPGFMIQGGDPMGNGRGGPGFTITDDFPNQHGMHFSKGTLGMAKTMLPNSGGCQFFITVADTPHLDNGYTIFGHVLSGQEVADKISTAPRGAMDRPNEEIKINHVTISDKR